MHRVSKHRNRARALAALTLALAVPNAPAQENTDDGEGNVGTGAGGTVGSNPGGVGVGRLFVRQPGLDVEVGRLRTARGPDGSTYISGATRETVTLPGAGGSALTFQPFSPIATHNYIIAKRNPAGEWVWTTRLRANNVTEVRAITVTGDGQAVYVAGSFRAAFYEPDPPGGPNETHLSDGVREGFVLRLDAATGERDWFLRTDCGAGAFIDIQDIGADPFATGDGRRIFICGEFEHDAGGPGEATIDGTTLFTGVDDPNDHRGLFVAKINDTGSGAEWTWVNSGGGMATDGVLPAADADPVRRDETASSLAFGSGGVYVAGRTHGGSGAASAFDPNYTGRFADRAANDAHTLIYTGRDESANTFNGTTSWYVARFDSFSGQNTHINFERDNYYNNESRPGTFSEAAGIRLDGGSVLVTGRLEGDFTEFNIPTGFDSLLLSTKEGVPEPFSFRLNLNTLEVQPATVRLGPSLPPANEDSTRVEESAFAVSRDADGAVYFSGWFSSLLSFPTDDGAPIILVPEFPPAGPRKNAFLGKQNPNGLWEWVVRFQAHDLRIKGLAANADNVFAAGFFAGTMTEPKPPGDPGWETTTDGLRDGFVMGLDAATGEHVWFRRTVAEPRAFAEINDVVAAPGDRVYVCGDFEDFFQLTPTVIISGVSPDQGLPDLDATHTPGSSPDNIRGMFVAEITDAGGAGNWGWVNDGGGADVTFNILGAADAIRKDESARAIAVDAAGDVYVAGLTQGGTDSSGAFSATSGAFNNRVPPDATHTTEIKTGLDETAGSGWYKATTSWFVAKFRKSDGRNLQVNYERDNYWNDESRPESSSEATDVVVINNQVFVCGLFDGALSEPNVGFNPAVNNADFLGTDRGETDGFILHMNTNLHIQSYATITGEGDDAIRALATDTAGNVYATGTFGEPSARLIAFPFKPVDSDTVDFDSLPTQRQVSTTGGGNLFTARLGSDSISGLPEKIRWDWARIPSNDASPPGVFLPADLALNPGGDRLYLAGNFGAGDATFGTGFSRVTLDQPEGQGAYLAAVDPSNGILRSQALLRVSSAFGAGEVEPVIGEVLVFQGSSVTVRAPARIYERKDGGADTVLASLAEEDDLDTSPFGTRRSCTGYTLGDGITGDTEPFIAFTINEDTAVTFNWTTEHKLEIDNLGSGFDIGDDALRALGAPNPPAGAHWIEENAEVSPSVNGAEISTLANDIGRRFVVEGYDGTGDAPSSGGGFMLSTGRIQVGDGAGGDFFLMTEPTTLAFNWKEQFSVTVDTTNAATDPLPRIFVTDASGQGNADGVGVFWFDTGTALHIGSKKVDGAFTLTGWVGGTGHFEETTFPDPGTVAPLSDVLDDGVDADFFGLDVDSLTRATRVTWNYGDTVYLFTIPLGEGLDPLDTGVPIVGGGGDLTISPSSTREVTVIAERSPPGSTAEDMQAWDGVGLQLFPLRPGAFTVLWTEPDGDRIITQIASGFPGGPVPDNTPEDMTDDTFFPGLSHFRHVANTPPVDLNPNGDDVYHFLEPTYTSADLADFRANDARGVAASVVESNYTADTPSHSVLLFSESPDPALPASGDLSRESLRVRVVETKLKGSVTVENDNDQSIGDPITSIFDTAGLGGGYLHMTDDERETLQINAAVYLAEEAAKGYGPVIPVNRRLPAHGLVGDPLVVWFERSEENILWPYQPVLFTGAFVWPPDPPRIVIASRLGSEGVDAAGDEQTSYDATLFEAVAIYNQPDPALPGYNPNEENAFIAPSFQFLDAPNPPPTAYALQTGAFNDTDDPNGADYTSEPFVLVEYFDLTTGRWDMEVYTVEEEDAGAGYTFDYPMEAGEPIVAPYPLNLVIGATPCVNTDGPTYNPAETPDGTTYEDGDPGQRTYWESVRGIGYAVSGDGSLRARFFFPFRADFFHPDPGVEVGDCIPFVPDVDGVPVPVDYNTTWPADVPVLKLGETLTFAGGEFAADNPGAPGLPGVVGWAAGEVVFDTRNPTMGADFTIADNYSVRLADPLLERRTGLPLEDFPEELLPAGGRTRVVGTEFRFDELSAGLQRRVFYDFLTGELGVRGILADRTIGDPDLTAAPPPGYLLEPNILTKAEQGTLVGLSDEADWEREAGYLFFLSRDPDDIDGIDEQSDDDYLVGLRPGNANEPDFVPKTQLGPGLALIPNHVLLDPDVKLDPANNRDSGYVTLAENNHESLGAAPVTLHIIRLEKEQRYRGSIKVLFSDNAFDEKVTLRHTGDFGANADDLVFQWFLREEDGTEAPLPATAIPDPWQLFGKSGAGRLSVDLAGTGEIIVRDNLFFARYRHQNETTASEIDWAGSQWEEYGAEWAGAANSPDVDGNFLPQLLPGWVKRVLDAINPYEARISDFNGSESPATYSSMVQQFGPRYEGQVALNPDKNVIENVGLIELYQTVLNRAQDITINLTQPATSPGVTNALLLAGSRIASFYTVLGHHAYGDATDPTVGIDGGSVVPTVHAFENMIPGVIEEELALLRGVDYSFGRPVYNRLFWNFTKGAGEAAYALNYNIQDVNDDGFVDELDAQRLYPQGHGDAWGHYLSALKGYYDLLLHPFFNWVSRSEFYTLQGVVFDVDFLDERTFARAAAAKAKAGAEIVDLTYRSHFVDDPGGQWQGYTDTDSDRAWGVEGWARRAGQAALFDWAVVNAILPSEDPDPSHEGLQKIDRGTVGGISGLSASLADIQTTYDEANDGLSPLGLDPDAVPFDIEPNFTEVGSITLGTTHFEQVFDRATASLATAKSLFDASNRERDRLRGVANTTEGLRQSAADRDRSLRNQLIAIFGTPYEGTIGPGLPYPPGYAGPDLNLFMYVEVNEVTHGRGGTVPPTSGSFEAVFKGFRQFAEGSSVNVAGDDPEAGKVKLDGRFKEVFKAYFVTDTGDVVDPAFFSSDTLRIHRLPASAGDYTFAAPDGWGQRASPGELQTIINQIVRAEANLAFDLSNYEGYVAQIEDMIGLIVAKHGFAVETLGLKEVLRSELVALNAISQAFTTAANALSFTADIAKTVSDALSKGLPTVVGFSNDTTFFGRSALTSFGAFTQFKLRLATLLLNEVASVASADKERLSLNSSLDQDVIGLEEGFASQLQELEQELRNEGTMRLQIFTKVEQLRQLGDKYRSTLQKGFQLVEERRIHNLRTAAAVQENRYEDFIFRVRRNGTLEKYRAAFEVAARYAYLAAKAYDFDTNLSPEDAASPAGLFNGIVRARRPGELSTFLTLLNDNYAVLKGRLGLNNSQFETGKFSLRREMLRIKGVADSDANWRAFLNDAEVKRTDLWQVPEFRLFCRPFAPPEAGPQPGLVIPFSTEITAGNNFFGWPLAPGDHSYDPTVFANKIKGVGAWFTGYDTAALAEAPRVYLVPAGLDVMSVPTSERLETRVWHIVDQSIPVPFAIGNTDLEDPDWIADIDSLDGPFGQSRRHSSFRAYHDLGDEVDESELVYGSRLIGRSVWNTNWLLIIPGQTFLADPLQGLDAFIDSVSDIRLYFETYGYSGN